MAFIRYVHASPNATSTGPHSSKPVALSSPNARAAKPNPQMAPLDTELSNAAILGIAATAGILGLIIYFLATPLTPAQRISLGARHRERSGDALQQFIDHQASNLETL